MDETMHVGIITVTFNSSSVIRDFLNSVLLQKYNKFTLYIVDNASSDATLSQAAEHTDPRITMIRNPVNVGAAEGNNIGIMAALRDGCSHIMLVNNDTVFESDLLSQLLTGLKRHDVDMVVPKILYFDEPDKIWSAGGYFSRVRGSARHFGSDRKDDGQFDDSRTVEYAPTTCMLFRKEVFERVGLLDPNYFAYFEDTDFCYRARAKGMTLFYFAPARLLHKVSSLTGRDSDFTIGHSIRNHVYYIMKNFPMWQRLYYFPALQVHLIAKFLIAWRDLRIWRATEKAFFDGVALYGASASSKAFVPNKLDPIKFPNEI
jgi:GT2 family glycosyltransferase